ncbi:MAG: AMP-binding protein, partial [Pseudomonadota bacterium]
MTDGSLKQIGFTDINLSERSLQIEDRSGGVQIVRSGMEIPEYPTQLSDFLRARAAEHPERDFLAERDGNGAWRSVSYGEMRGRTDSVSQWLLNNGHSADNPICILSDNSINFATLMLGAMQVGIPVMPISPAYSLMSSDYAKVKFAFESFTPTLVYAEKLGPFVKALGSVDLASIQVVAGDHEGEIPGTFGFNELLSTTAGPDVEGAYAKVTPDSIGKVLLTSGSTGMPKGVINPQRMLTSNAVQVGRLWPFLADRPPVVVDWLPWNHTFGANFCFNTIMSHGGTMYIDAGKPVPGRFDATLTNLRDVRPTIMWNVARAYDLLAPELDKDDDFNRHLFGDLDMAFYAGAGLPQSIWDHLETLSVKARGKRTPLLTSLGSTETGPSAICCHWTSDVTGSIGHPVPGLEAKLIPVDGKTELRVKGPNITPGYYRDEAKTAAAFDEDGFFKIGDAVKWAEPADP